MKLFSSRNAHHPNQGHYSLENYWANPCYLHENPQNQINENPDEEELQNERTVEKQDNQIRGVNL